MRGEPLRALPFLLLLSTSALMTAAPPAAALPQDDVVPVSSDECVACHDTDQHGQEIGAVLEASIHGFLECLDCHEEAATLPHDEESTFRPGHDACASCHVDEADEYQVHGRTSAEARRDIPDCWTCHGTHNIQPSSLASSKTHPRNLATTCGACHENLDLTTRFASLIDHPVEIFQSSVHGRTDGDGGEAAATCTDCHSAEGTSHKILSPGEPRSSINHFAIPKTCGVCHPEAEREFREGIHGQLVARGETDAPVCTHCHGEHGIIPHDDPRSPVSRARLAEATCEPCHESAALNEKYAYRTGRLVNFIDSYHGLKTKAGDALVANCASCHGFHRILPSSDPTSTIHPANVRATCSACHPRISARLASAPIHGVTGERLRAPVADVVEAIYIVAIVVIIGLMVIHWLLDLRRHIRQVMTRQPQVRRMRPDEVWQHALLMLSFIVLVVSGFALRSTENWLTRLFFGWSGGFEMRGTVHRVAAVVFIATTLWHLVFLFTTRRGRTFCRDMYPRPRDFSDFVQRILFTLGRRSETPRFGRFSYVEKAEYWALVWGTVVMIVTGLLLWFDNAFVQVLPKAVLDVSLVVHYWEAWLATLAIVVWHLYSTIFNPHVYPMNPSWLTGTMPEEMYRHEHPEHVEEAKRETEERGRHPLDRMAREPR